MSYLCNRNRETKIANDKVPWMSGLVSGLQNRVRRFESARNLQKQERIRMKISNPFVFQQLTSSVVEVEKGGLSTPATPLEMLRLYRGQRIFRVGKLSFRVSGFSWLVSFLLSV